MYNDNDENARYVRRWGVVMVFGFIIMVLCLSVGFIDIAILMAIISTFAFCKLHL